MSAHSTALNSTNTSTWAGGKSPFNVTYGKLMMWIFLLSDAFTFSSLLVCYGATRFSYSGNTITPEPSPDKVFNTFPGLAGDHYPLMFVSLMTFILIASSVTMVLAVEAGHRNSRKEVAKFMLMTIVGGAMFLGCQAIEWTHLIHEGATLGHNPWGPGPFSALFFIITGFHGFHVFSGVALNVVIYFNVLNGTYERRGHYEMIEKVGLYWHFVDLVWVFVFTFFYLI